jgi:hypothetical protein
LAGAGEWNRVTLRIIWHNFLLGIWHSGPSEKQAPVRY